MPETIEAFIDRLQADGVEAGQEAADRIRAEAEKQAQQLIREAEAQARRIIDDARAEKERMQAKTQTELELAARDTVIRLREALTRALQRLLVAGAAEKLDDAQFIQALLHDIVMQYARADIEGADLIVINVSEEMRRQLTHWAIHVLHQDLVGSGTHVDLRGDLAGAGFEYTVSLGTVEVTVESVAETLAGLVGPELRDMVVRAAADGDQAACD